MQPGVVFANALANYQGDIINRGNLAVDSRKTLSLSGSNAMTTGNLTAPAGKVEVLGTKSVALLENATIDVSSATGGGTILIGAEFQGQDFVPDAKRTYVGNNVTINANALTHGNGGRVIVWADEVTGFYGTISARGGSISGNGGFVEVSGKNHLIFRGNVDTNAVNGFTGTLLLDPTNITIANDSGDEAGDGTDTFSGNNSGIAGSILSAPLSEIDDTAPTTIYESELEGLSGDTNVILQATNNITLEDLADDKLNFAPGNGVIALTADADRNGVGDFVMEDNTSVLDEETFIDADTIRTNGRNIAISGANLTLGNILTGVEGTEATFTESITTKNSGSITLNADNGNINIIGGQINSVTGIRGNTGEINITADSLFVTNGTINVGNFGVVGDTGKINITASNNITIDNADVINVNAFGVGDLGGITITTGSLSLINRGQITSDTRSQGNAGLVEITASDDITIDNSSVSSETNRIGDAGGVTINTGSLTLTNGGNVSASTFGQGNAGDVTINAKDSITISAVNIFNAGTQTTRSGISANAIVSNGNSGNINVAADEIIIDDGGAIEAGNFDDRVPGFSGTGQPGNINIKANSLSLTNEARIETATQSETGNTANINLQLTEELSLRDNSFISARALKDADGGNLNINARFILGFPSSGNGNDLIATADKGNGGNITINARQIFNLQEGQAIDENGNFIPNNRNDIDASGSTDGVVSITIPDVDPLQGLDQLSIEVVDASQLITNRCLVGDGETADQPSEFTITGRGGLPSNPRESLRGEAVLSPEWVSLEYETEEDKRNSKAEGQMSIVPSQVEIVQATGWIIRPNGKVSLIANNPNSVPSSPGINHPHCHATSK